MLRGRGSRKEKAKATPASREPELLPTQRGETGEQQGSRSLPDEASASVWAHYSSTVSESIL